jgi:hypothetical protein
MKGIAVVMVALALAAAACQSASDQIAEQIIEQQEGVENVDIDTETGEVSIETDEGSFSIGGDEIPAGFPIPFPSGYEVVSVFSSDTGGAVAVISPGDRWDEIVGFYDDWTAGQSGEWQTGSYSTDSGDGTTQRGSSWSESSTQISASDCFGLESDTLDSVCVTAVAGG